jgi:hypothetical protein
MTRWMNRNSVSSNIKLLVKILSIILEKYAYIWPAVIRGYGNYCWSIYNFNKNSTMFSMRFINRPELATKLRFTLRYLRIICILELHYSKQF